MSGLGGRGRMAAWHRLFHSLLAQPLRKAILSAIRAMQGIIGGLGKQWKFPLFTWTHNALQLIWDALDLYVFPLSSSTFGTNNKNDDISQSIASHVSAERWWLFNSLCMAMSSPLSQSSRRRPLAIEQLICRHDNSLYNTKNTNRVQSSYIIFMMILWVKIQKFCAQVALGTAQNIQSSEVFAWGIWLGYEQNWAPNLLHIRKVMLLHSDGQPSSQL